MVWLWRRVFADFERLHLVSGRCCGWAADVGNIHGAALNTTTDADTTHIWLMGDGQGDAFSIIYNQVFPGNSDTRLDMKNMTAGDIVNISI